MKLREHLARFRVFKQLDSIRKAINGGGGRNG